MEKSLCILTSNTRPIVSDCNQNSIRLTLKLEVKNGLRWIMLEKGSKEIVEHSLKLDPIKCIEDLFIRNSNI